MCRGQEAYIRGSQCTPGSGAQSIYSEKKIQNGNGLGSLFSHCFRRGKYILIFLSEIPVKIIHPLQDLYDTPASNVIFYTELNKGGSQMVEK